MPNISRTVSMGSLGSGGNGGDLPNLDDRLHGRVLENVTTCFVKPATATPIEKEWLPLCNLDYSWMTYYTPLICTFALADHASVQHLKESLAEALVLFYPLAGRVLTQGGPPRIHCSDAGAVFTEASVDAEMATLIRTEDFLPVPLLSGLAAAGLQDYPALPQMPAGLPTLIIQVTHFSCGGIALAANWSHGAADGRSGLHFMKSWSEIARGEEISLLPDHRRELVQPRDPPVPTDLVKPMVVSPAAKMSKVDHSLEVPATKTSTQVTTKVVEITSNEVTRMRKAAITSTTPGAHFTRADCTFTHLWRTIVRARNLPLSARIRLWILVEGRKKLSLPAGYFGNVIGRISVDVTVEELLSGPFSDIASLIHSGITSVTGEWFQGVADWIQMRGEYQSGHGNAGRYQLLAPEALGPGAECSISHLVWFPFYDLDFGFGTPACSMPNALHAPSHADVGSAYVSPSAHGPDRMVVMINLESPAVSRFISLAHNIPG